MTSITDALAADLEALAHAHPVIAGTLHLVATTLVEQKAEIKLLSENTAAVKGALSQFLKGRSDDGPSADTERNRASHARASDGGTSRRSGVRRGNG